MKLFAYLNNTVTPGAHKMDNMQQMLQSFQRVFDHSVDIKRITVNNKKHFHTTFLKNSLIFQILTRKRLWKTNLVDTGRELSVHKTFR